MKLLGLLEEKGRGREGAVENVWLARGEVLTRGEEGAGEIAWLTIREVQVSGFTV